jgi:hypothetical protein
MTIIDAIRQDEPGDGYFCPCCGDIITEGHQCEEDDTPTKPHTATYSPEDDT